MSVRINFEIGHEASIRTKRTQEGFTHDWEVFVRGCDGANIHYYVEKVVFYLHETFPKPKRVIKEPPYAVKESGYAGFTLPVEIYFRNKDEPKKITLTYDLSLQPSGGPMSKALNKKYVFNMPGEDFKLKLLKGGGVVVNSSNSQDALQENRTPDDKSQLFGKPKLGGSDVIKKHKSKIEVPRNSFQALFGAPITKTSKTSVEVKPISKDKNSNLSKSELGDKEKLKKHSPHKDKDKDKIRDKEDKLKRDEKKREDRKDRSKDREDKVKERKRDKSPKIRSPTPTKRPSSPKRPPSPPVKHKEEKKLEVPKEKKTLDDREKSEKKIKKEKRDKERKDGGKYKDREQKSVEQKENKIVKEKERHKEENVLPVLRNEKEKVIKDYVKESKEPAESIEKNGKLKTDRLEEKVKHKHKRKDKEKKEKSSEKSHKSEKKLEKLTSKYVETKEAPKENEKTNLFDSPKQMTSIENKSPDKSKKPLTALLTEFGESDSSNSSISSREDLFNEPAPVVKKEPLFEPEVRLEPDKKVKKEKSKKNKDKKSEKSSDKKRKRKSDVPSEAPSEKIAKEESSNSKESDAETNFVQEKQAEAEENYEDYMNILRDLQHKILTLQDNAELQRVVQLIAETGRFEVSAQTFDFDLCLLERSTITQLQNFFASPS